MNDKIAKLLAALQAEGLKIKLQPESVTLHVGKLDVENLRSPGTSANTRVFLDGKSIEKWLRSIDVRCAVAEVNSATIVLGVVP